MFLRTSSKTTHKAERKPSFFTSNIQQSNKNFSTYTPPSLPIVNRLVQKHKPRLESKLEKTILVAVPHFLPTSASLFDAFLELGMQPENIFLSGKFYSTCDPVEHHLISKGIHVFKDKFPDKPTDYQAKMINKWCDIWQKIINHIKEKEIEKIIVMDDGGYAIAQMPTILPLKIPTAIIEQTQHGLYNPRVMSMPVPLIPVASAAVKKIFEAPLIAKQILSRIDQISNSLSFSKNYSYGIIGNGAIGASLASHLVNQNYEVLVYDANPNAFHPMGIHGIYRINSLPALISQSDVIFGCTGKNSLENLDLMKMIQSSKTFMSCSSQNVEFFSLLKQAEQKGYHFSLDKNIPYLYYMHTLSHNEKEIRIVQSGFPLNFTKVVTDPALEEGHPASDMELTRGLLFSAFIAAVENAKTLVRDGITGNESWIIPVNESDQRWILKEWLKYNPQPFPKPELIELFNDLDWIKKNSFPNKIEESIKIPEKKLPFISDLFSKYKLPEISSGIKLNATTPKNRT